MNSHTKIISWKSVFFNSFFSVFTWELVEELFESIIAFALSSACAIFFAKAISTFAIVGFTQLTKKGIQKVLYLGIKKLTYKQGDDKMNFIKKIFKTIYANKCSLITILTSIMISLTGTGVVDVNNIAPIEIITEEAIVEVVVEQDVLATEIIYAEDGETIIYNVGDVITPAGTILVEGKDAEVFNLTPIIYYALLSIILIVFGIFPETKEAFDKRVAEQKVIKEQKALEKIAFSEIKEEEKKANQTQAEQEKAQAKAEAERIANAEKERVETERRAKIEEIKAKLLSQK
jgi:hypothetical protein